MSQPWRDVAIYGTAAFTGLLTGLPTGEAANCLKLLFDGREPNLEAMAKRAERALASFTAHDQRGVGASFQAAIVERLKQHGWSAAVAVSHELKPEGIAAAVIPDGDPLFTDELKGQEPLARQIVATVYEAVLADPVHFNAALPKALSVLLQPTAEIQDLPRATVDAFLDLQTRLLLSPGTRTLPAGEPKPSELLRSEHVIVPFDDARAPDVESVLAWCRDPGRRAVRLIHGPGGHGKTRLLIEVMRLLGPGWHAGFLERIEPSPPGGTYERLCAGGRPVCIAVDYAETRREEVVRLLRRVHGGTAPRLRVVLLARSPGEWWGQLAEEDADVQALLRRYKSEYRLEVLPDDLVTRQAAFTSAARAFAARLSLGIVPPVPPGLTRPEFGRFLLVHMAALAAVDGQRPSTVGELLAGTLEREARHWRLGLKDLGLDSNRYRALVAQAVTLATLAGGLRSTGELKQAIAAAPRAGGLPDVDLYAIADILARLYPDPNGLGALRLDLLGEELAAKELRQDAALLDKAFSPAVPAERLANGLTVLSRLARREPEQIDLLRAALAGRLDRLAAPGVKVAVETGGPLGRVLAATLRGEPPANPRSLQRLLPQHTVALREFRVVVAEQIRAVLLSSPERASMPNRAELARITAMLGVYLGELNRPEAALAAAEEATATYRALAAVQPAALPSLAASLSSLSTRLRSLNRHEAALAAAKEAITTFRAAALAHPEVPRHGLAASLSNLSVLLGDLNRPGEALAAAKEAAAIYRALAETHPEISRPGLAASLSNLAGWLRGLKRLDDALPVLQEAIGTYRILAAANHDAFRPELAQSLSNLGLLLSQTNRRGEALLAEEEAVATRRALAAADPDAFRPNLARSLSNLGDRLEENGRLADALAADREAITVIAPFTKRLSEAFAPSIDLYVQCYRLRCASAGVEPDAALLALARHASVNRARE